MVRDCQPPHPDAIRPTKPLTIDRVKVQLREMGLSAHGFSARFWSIIGATFLGFLGIGTVLPGLAPHIRNELGGSDRTVGFVIGIFSFVALVSRFFSGPLADRRGRKTALMTGVASCAVAGAVYLLPMGIAGAYLGRILQGFGEACLYTGAAAWVVEMAGVHRSGQALGYLSSGIWGGISAGPVIGQWASSFERAALTQAVLALLAFAILTRIEEDYEPETHPLPGPWLPRRLILPGIALGFVNVHFPIVTGFLILHLAHHGNSGPAAFSAYALMILLSRFFLGSLPDRIHPAVTFYGGLVAMTCGLVVLATGPPPWLAVAAAGVLGLGFSFPWSSIASTVLRATPNRERGSAIGVLSAFYDLFVGVSSFTAGAIANRFGYSATFAMAAAALAVAAMVGRFVFRQIGRQNTIPEEECVPMQS
ncbi:MAG: MFS transporter [Acidobacteriota bacterium]|nr:MFS transporter [Acidobacteriota bacterium]